MKISVCLEKESCIVDLKASTKEEAIIEIVNQLARAGKVVDKHRFINDILAREKLGSTGIGHKVAIPHSPTEGVEGFVMGFGRSVEGIDFGSSDGDKVNLVFLMGTNPAELNLYLKFLAKLSRFLNEESFRNELIAAKTADEIIQIFTKHET
jgi:fructose-specific phosphotransferase system IIA component